MRDRCGGQRARARERRDARRSRVLTGNWTSDQSGFVIEENRTDDGAGVVLGMSRGVQSFSVRFLRFAVVEQAGMAVVMRFKRYNADSSS